MNTLPRCNAFGSLVFLILLGTGSVCFANKPKERVTPTAAEKSAASGQAWSDSSAGANSSANSNSTAGSKSDSTSTAPPASGLKGEELVPTLQRIYTVLSRADHDYDGHRAAAMREMESAAGLLKGKLVGSGDGRERQALSDTQIRSAQMALLSVGRSASLEKKKEVTARISAAIEQLNLALESEGSTVVGGAGKKQSGAVGSSGGDATPDPIGGNSVELASLARIYRLLAQADHDYHGHRAAAMKAIAQASKSLGGDLKGDGRNRENQKLSDSELQQAQELLGQVETAYANSGNSKVKADLSHAVAELSTALKLK